MVIKNSKPIFNITIISLVFPYPKSGVLPGVENYVRSIAIPLKKLGHNVRIITTYWNGTKKFDIYEGIPIIRVIDSKALFGKLGSLFNVSYITFGLNLLLKRNYKYYCNSDLIIIPLAIGFSSYFKLRNFPVISIFLHYDLEKSFIDFLTLPFYHFLERRQFKKHKHIITISNSSKKDLIKYYRIDDKYIKVLPVGIDINKFNPLNYSKNIRKKYGNNILLYVGPFLKRKRISVLLKALSHIIKEIPDIHLILIGEGPLWKHCKVLSYKFGVDKNTSFLGFVETNELLKYYASSDIFVFPSELEGFGQVLLEAMASGTPCICANKEPMSEIIGDAGTTFIVNDSNDLAIKIIDLLSDKEKLKKLNEKALERAKKYEDKRVIKEFMKNVEKIIIYHNH